MRTRPEINEISHLLAYQSTKRSGGLPGQPIHERLHKQKTLGKQMAEKEEQARKRKEEKANKRREKAAV